MNFKKKAGLALALAAIFTTGGANLALAEQNVTGGDTGTITGGDGEGTLNLTGTAANADLTVGAGGVDVKAIVAEKASVTSVTLTGTGTEVVTIQGTGGEIASNAATKDALDVTIDQATLSLEGTGSMAGTLTLTDAVTSVIGDYDLSQVVADATTTIFVGDAANTGSLDVANLVLGGGILFTDPSWIETYNASTTTIDRFSTAANNYKVDGRVTVGQNSQLTIGEAIAQTGQSTAKGAWLEKVVKHTDNWGSLNNLTDKYTAALGLFTPQVLDTGIAGTSTGTGGLLVDGALNDVNFNSGGGTIATANTATFANNSLFAVDLTNVSTAVDALTNDAANANANLAVTIGGVSGGAAALNGMGGIYLANANANTTGVYNILGRVNTLTVNGVAVTDTAEFLAQTTNGTANYWDYNGNTMQFSSDLLRGRWNVVDNTASGEGYDLQLVVERNGDSVRQHYPHLSNGIAGMVNALYANGTGANNTVMGEVNGGSDNAGIVFVSRATDNLFFADHKEGAKVLEGAAQIAVAAGVPTIANNIVNKFSSLIVDHASLLTETQPAYGNEPGQFGLWLTPFYQYSDVDGMDAGRFENDYEISYGGAAFGLDYNVNEAFRLGLALNVGGGDSESQGDFNKTENDFDFFGVSIYGTYTNGAFGLTGDIGYTAIDNEIDQKLPAAMGMGSKLRADVDSDAFTVGLTGEYRFVTGSNLNVTPHLGLRYTKISTDDANVKADGRHIFKVDTEDQNLFQIPLGVKFSGDIITDGGWTVTPSADLGVLFTMGDTDVDSKARIVNTGFRGTTNSDVVDSAAFQGALGIKAKADNGLTLGLDYGILASGNQTDHSVSGLLRYEF